jgi:hypothetical protein
MNLDDPLDYGQASAGSFALFIYFVEQFEDLIMLAGTYPHPIVPYEENGLISVKAMTDFDVDQFVEALNGKLTGHHRFLLKLHQTTLHSWQIRFRRLMTRFRCA